MTWTPPKWLDIAVAVVFLIVGIIAASNTFRLNAYIRETVPRDVAQERCNTETIAVLKSWVATRVQRDDAMNARDDAAVAVLDHEIVGELPPPALIQAWRDAVAKDRAVRAAAGERLVSLPKC